MAHAGRATMPAHASSQAYGLAVQPHRRLKGAVCWVLVHPGHPAGCGTRCPARWMLERHGDRGVRPGVICHVKPPAGPQLGARRPSPGVGRAENGAGRPGGPSPRPQGRQGALTRTALSQLLLAGQGCGAKPSCSAGVAGHGRPAQSAPPHQVARAARAAPASCSTTAYWAGAPRPKPPPKRGA